MIDISIGQLISLIVGLPILSWITTLGVLKYRKLKEKGIAKQELEKAEDLDLRNTKALIELYKTGMQDLQEIMQSRESLLSKKIADYDEKISKYESENKQLRDLVNTMRKNQILMQTKLDALTVQSLQDCDKCSFKSECLKYKAKLYINEDKNIEDGNKANAKNIHG